MKGRPVEQLVYEYMFAKPRSTDPPNFAVFLQRFLVLEVRNEVHAFYGHLDTQEAKYPGLDYTHPTHRMRLSRWQWHRRLFRAFDALRLTPNEIAGLTKWEGTKWAKERYEREQGITIRDTTGDEFSEWVPPSQRRAREPSSRQRQEEQAREQTLDGTTAEDSEEELASVGVDLNQRLMERVRERDLSGDLSIHLDEEWEQWFKEHLETGDLTQPGSSPTPNLSASQMIAAARNGDWTQIPSALHDIFRTVVVQETLSHWSPVPLPREMIRGSVENTTRNAMQSPTPAQSRVPSGGSDQPSQPSLPPSPSQVENIYAPYDESYPVTAERLLAEGWTFHPGPNADGTVD